MIAWVVVIVLLAAAVMFLVVVAARMRGLAARLPGVAGQLGLAYDGDDPFGLLDEGFALVKRGHHRRVSSVMHGSLDGLDVRVFGLFHVVGRGRFRQTHAEACVMVRVPGLGFWFRAEPWGRYGLAKPMRVPTPTGDATFDRHWAADAPDDTTMHAVLDGSFRTLLTTHPEKPYVGANDGWVLVAARGQRPDRLPSFVRDAVVIARRLADAPETTVRELLGAGDVARAEALLDAVPNGATAADDPDTSLRAAVLAARAAQLASDDPEGAATRYARAAEEQRSFASTATSGGEGLARSRVVDELEAKAARTRS